MISPRSLNDVQAEFSKVENILAALDLVVEAVDESAQGARRKNLDALIGVTAAARQQIQVAQDALTTLIKSAQTGKEGAA